MCGPFVWDPPPGPNAPLTVTVTASPATPKRGEAVTFSVVVDDPDARITRNFNNSRNFGDGVVDAAPSSPVSCPQQFGVWTPPPRAPDHYEVTFQHVYAAEGRYSASFSFESSSGCGGPGPYGGQATGSVVVSVTG